MALNKQPSKLRDGNYKGYNWIATTNAIWVKDDSGKDFVLAFDNPTQADSYPHQIEIIEALIDVVVEYYPIEDE